MIGTFGTCLPDSLAVDPAPGSFSLGDDPQAVAANKFTRHPAAARPLRAASLGVSPFPVTLHINYLSLADSHEPAVWYVYGPSGRDKAIDSYF